MPEREPIFFKCDVEKMVETIVYLANKVPGLKKRQLFSLLYFADKTHLEQYGSFIYGETYYATKEGVVPLHASLLLDIVAGKDFDPTQWE